MNKNIGNEVVLVINVPVASCIQNSNKNEIKLEEINKLYVDLTKEIKHMILDNLTKDEYKNKILNEIDYRPISHLLKNVYKENKSEDEKYITYQNGKEKSITHTIRNETYRFDERRLNNLLDIYLGDLEEEKEFLNIETLGTSLNALREFYPDLFSSVNRIKKNGPKNISETFSKYYFNDFFKINESLKEKEENYILNFSRGKIDD